MKLIMSASRATLGAVANHERTMELAARLARGCYDFRVVLGVFEEDNQTVATEVSFMVTHPVDLRLENAVDAIAATWAASLHEDYHQECILAISDIGECYLFYPDNRTPEYIGVWTQVEQRPSGNATQVDGKWYTAIKGDAL